MSKISLLNILALTAKDAILINPRFFSFIIVALDAINSAKENGHEGQVCHVWSFLACFYCLDCHGCHEIKSYLPLMPFLARKRFLGIQGLIGCLGLAMDASDLAKNFL